MDYLFILFFVTNIENRLIKENAGHYSITADNFFMEKYHRFRNCTLTSMSKWDERRILNYTWDDTATCNLL